MRRGIAATAAALLIVEAFGLAFINWVLGLAVRHQSMSLAGIAPAAMAAGAWAAGGLLALFLFSCAGLLGRAAWNDRPPGRFGRALLTGCVVLHGVLGAAVVGLVGWPAFAAMMLIFGLVLWSLLFSGYEGRIRPEHPGPAAGPEPREPPENEGGASVSA